MFTTEERQRQRTGKYGTDRLQYLQDLVTQFQGNATEEFKEEIVAHLANFAYDPFNYEYFRNLHIVDLFLDGLTEPSERMIEFSMGGIANCCVDPENAAIILKNGGIPLIISCLKSPVENTVLSSMAALYYLCSPETRDEILTGEVVQYMNIYSAAKETNVRFSSLAQAFLDKHVLSHA